MFSYFMLCLFTIAVGTLQGSASNNIAKEGCQTHCGDIEVPYPFGIDNNTNCAVDNSFYVTCNSTYNPPQLFIQSSNIRIFNISDSELRIGNSVSFRCFYENGSLFSEYNGWINLAGLFTFSEKNKFTIIGCDDIALITGSKRDDFNGGCFGLCSKTVLDKADGRCLGNGCCQTSITNGLDNYDVTLASGGNHTDVWSFNRCGLAFLGEEGSFEYHGARDLSNASDAIQRIESTVPIVLDWVIAPNKSCSEATECKANSKCYDVEGTGYRCKCRDGYEGNPYLDQGCQDIDECKDLGKYTCHGTCFNTPVGNYTCKCKRGYVGDGKLQGGCQRKPFQTLLFSLGIGLSILAILIGLAMIYFIVNKRRLIKIRENFFEQNGGALLKDKLKIKGGVGVSSMIIFRVEELEEATDNFAEGNILGKGGNGIVYKGTLSDKRVVAIKKSQRLDEGQREEFINEMVILTQINHQNVVQLLGCCLETDIPLLVYEFVSNDTLHRHIHNRKSGMGRLSWDSRLRIAHESAGALAYLHTDARMSIIHRDAKSTNILLDENYTAKIADFGASRLVPLGHDEVITLVQGTFGYLDPEYFHTGQLTDRSDVYSFGVVLAELLTGEKALGVDRCVKDRSLATYFVKAKKENRLHDIIDHQVAMEATDEQIKATCDLISRCLNQVGGNRPSMKEVTMELETLRKFGKHPWNSQENYNETSSLMIESEEFDLYTIPLVANSDTFGEYSSSSTGIMKEIMLQVQDPR